jgi:hypothetical protein
MTLCEGSLMIHLTSKALGFDKRLRTVDDANEVYEAVAAMKEKLHQMDSTIRADVRETLKNQHVEIRRDISMRALLYLYFLEQLGRISAISSSDGFENQPPSFKVHLNRIALLNLRSFDQALQR